VKTIYYNSQSDSSIVRTYSAQSNIEVPHGALLTFEYDLPFFTSPDNNQFKTYMEGYDDHWSGWSAAADKEYTNLPHGEYKFHVKALNVFGSESDESVVKFYNFASMVSNLVGLSIVFFFCGHCFAFNIPVYFKAS
jgi:hypothetical protein